MQSVLLASLNEDEDDGDEGEGYPNLVGSFFFFDLNICR